jgi:hypothetical protein
LSWGRQSVLNRLTKGPAASRGLMAEAGRVARQEFSKDSKTLFAETIEQAKLPSEPRRRSEWRRVALNQIFWLALIAKNHGSHFFNDAESFEGVFRRSSFAEPNGDTVGYVRRLTGPAVTKIWR